MAVQDDHHMNEGSEGLGERNRVATYNGGLGGEEMEVEMPAGEAREAEIATAHAFARHAVAPGATADEDERDTQVGLDEGGMARLLDRNAEPSEALLIVQREGNSEDGGEERDGDEELTSLPSVRPDQRAVHASRPPDMQALAAAEHQGEGGAARIAGQLARGEIPHEMDPPDGRPLGPLLALPWAVDLHSQFSIDGDNKLTVLQRNVLDMCAPRPSSGHRRSRLHHSKGSRALNQFFAANADPATATSDPSQHRTSSFRVRWAPGSALAEPTTDEYYRKSSRMEAGKGFLTLLDLDTDLGLHIVGLATQVGSIKRLIRLRSVCRKFRELVDNQLAGFRQLNDDRRDISSRPWALGWLLAHCPGLEVALLRQRAADCLFKRQDSTRFTNYLLQQVRACVYISVEGCMICKKRTVPARTLLGEQKEARDGEEAEGGHGQQVQTAHGGDCSDFLQDVNQAEMVTVPHGCGSIQFGDTREIDKLLHMDEESTGSRLYTAEPPASAFGRLLRLVDATHRTKSVVSELRFDADDDQFAPYPPNDGCVEQKMSMLRGISPADGHMEEAGWKYFDVLGKGIPATSIGHGDTSKEDITSDQDRLGHGEVGDGKLTQEQRSPTLAEDIGEPSGSGNDEVEHADGVRVGVRTSREGDHEGTTSHQGTSQYDACKGRGSRWITLLQHSAGSHAFKRQQYYTNVPTELLEGMIIRGYEEGFKIVAITCSHQRGAALGRVVGFGDSNATEAGERFRDDASWTIIMEHHPEYEQIYWFGRCDEGQLPKHWIVNKWEEGYFISQMAASPNRLGSFDRAVVVMSRRMPYTQQSYKTSRVFPFDWVQSKWQDGYRITAAIMTGVQWSILMSRGSGIEEQFLLMDSLGSIAPAQECRVKDNYCVTSTAVGQDICLRTFSKVHPLKVQRQRLYCTESFPEELIEQHWKQGWSIIGVATRGNG
mmetsp:Transcript_8814/g.32500  ORF Transcript_8814/g.32500 Transcript_8814/m.32500 type:complete len:943 (+) Transcript_8814:219-3047(+)